MDSIDSGLKNSSTTSSSSNAPSMESDDDDDVILIEQKIPFIDLCTPQVVTTSKSGFGERKYVVPDVTTLPNSRLNNGSANGSRKTELKCHICSQSSIGRVPHASITCGHVFCGLCIKRQIMRCKKCPKCNDFIPRVIPLCID